MERLTDDRFLKDGFYQPKSNDEEKEIRSMGKDLTFEKLYRHCAELEKKNAELQKQVDELKKKQVIECYGMIKGCDMVKQAVKDTAKEILTEIDDLTLCIIDGSKEFEKGYFQAIADMKTAIKDLLKEKYGVEVE